MKKFILFLICLFSQTAFASGGFTWLGNVSHMIHVPEHTISFLLVVLFIFGIGIVYRIKVSKVENIVLPDRGITIRNLVEAYGQFIYGQCKSVIGEKEAARYFPFIATLFLVILFSNLLGLVPGFLPPTDSLNTTLALGLFTFLFYNYEGIKAQGFIKYMKHFAGPLWYMAILIFPLEILSHIFRPISLALRLKGNMVGDHTVLTVFTDMAPFLVPTVFYLLGLLVCVVQAYVFTVLTMVYIGMAVAHHDHEEHAH